MQNRTTSTRAQMMRDLGGEHLEDEAPTGAGELATPVRNVGVRAAMEGRYVARLVIGHEVRRVGRADTFAEARAMSARVKLATARVVNRHLRELRSNGDNLQPDEFAAELIVMRYLKGATPAVAWRWCARWEMSDLCWREVARTPLAHVMDALEREVLL